MIHTIVFDDTIPVTLNERVQRFEACDGWDIREVAPGRVELRHPGVTEHVVVSQGMPYVLWREAETAELVAAEPAFGKKPRR